MNKYAILVGIDDQDTDGLTKCSKDVDDFGDVLAKKCKFKTINIFKIVSKLGTENKQALNEFNNTIEKLKDEPTFGSDDILLIYFSGHGSFDTISQKSYLKFPTSELCTEKIKEYIDQLHPKHSILIFDACFIGAKILSKSLSLNKLKRKFHVDSEGAFGIYGSPTEREAYLPKNLGNSLLTHFLIEIINDDNFYDEEGFLSIDNLASICAKKVYKYSAELVKSKKITKEQIIVREGRIEGWLPFAEINKQPLLSTLNAPIQITHTAKTSIDINQEQKDFNALLTAVKKELKEFKPVIAAIVISYYYDKRYEPSYSNYKEEIQEAIRKKIIDDDREVNFSNRYVSNLINAIGSLITFITNTNRTTEFNEYFDNKYEISINDNDNQTFWENVFDIKVPN